MAGVGYSVRLLLKVSVCLCVRARASARLFLKCIPECANCTQCLPKLHTSEHRRILGLDVLKTLQHCPSFPPPPTHRRPGRGGEAAGTGKPARPADEGIGN